MNTFFRPSSAALLRVPHRQQQTSGECLAACVDMVLTYYKAAYDYQRICRTLRIQPDLGAPFPNIVRLEQIGIVVGYRTNGTLETFTSLTHLRLALYHGG